MATSVGVEDLLDPDASGGVVVQGGKGDGIGLFIHHTAGIGDGAGDGESVHHNTGKHAEG